MIHEEEWVEEEENIVNERHQMDDDYDKVRVSCSACK